MDNISQFHMKTEYLSKHQTQIYYQQQLFARHISCFRWNCCLTFEYFKQKKKGNTFVSWNAIIFFFVININYLNHNFHHDCRKKRLLPKLRTTAHNPKWIRCHLQWEEMSTESLTALAPKIRFLIYDCMCAMKRATALVIFYSLHSYLRLAIINKRRSSFILRIYWIYLFT